MKAVMAAVIGLATVALAAQEVTKPEIAGVRNLSRLETTVACAGATGPEAMPAIKKMGFVSIINLRAATENGANVEAEEAAAKAAGLRYFNIPFISATPERAAADKFIQAITTKGVEPAFIHCAGGNRAATMWLIKRLVVDTWDVEKATAEATALGQTSATLRQFAIDYAKSVKR